MKALWILHHSADSSPGDQFDKINASHKSRGFPVSSIGFYVGYQAVIEKSGDLRRSRGWDERGAHTAASCEGEPCNVNAIGVCLAGDFTKEEPTMEQLDTLYRLWRDLGYPKTLLHSDVKRTACPGNFPFRNALQARYVADLTDRLKQGLRALPRLLGTSRGNILQRQITRLKRALGL